MMLYGQRVRSSRMLIGLMVLTMAGSLAAVTPTAIAQAAPLSPNTGARITTTGAPTAGPGGSIFYVNSSTGSDSNSGLTTGLAWQTLAKVNSASFAPGDVIAFQRGQTFTGSATIDDAGTSTNPILLTAYGSGSQPVLTNPGALNMLVLDAPYLRVANLAFTDGAVFDNSDGLGITGAKYENSGAIVVTGNGGSAIVEDNSFTNVGVGVKTYGASSAIFHNTFSDLQIAYRGPDSGSETSYGALGISVNNSGVEVAYNDFINCRSTNSPYGADGGAVEIEGFVYNKDNISIHHNYSQGSQGFLEVTETNTSNVSLTYNVSDDYQQFVAWDTTTNPNNYLVANNTIVRRHNSATSYLFDIFYYREAGPTPTSSWLTVRNNVFETPYQSAFGPFNWPHDHNVFYGGGDPVGDALDTGDIIADPHFVNYSGGDLRLTLLSPAVDNGAASTAGTDLDGATVGVGQGVDIGAFEYQTPGSGGSSVVNDGGFETQTSIGSSSSPWYSQGALNYGVDVNAGKSRSGLDNGWVATTSSTGWGALRQTVAVTANSTYRMTAWVRNSANFDNAYLGAKTTGFTVLNEIRHGKSAGYTRYIVTFDTGSNASVVLHIGFYGPGTSAWEQIDDVMLQKL